MSERRRVKPVPTSDSVLRTVNLVKVFETRQGGLRHRQKLTAVEDVNLSLGVGETLALVGESGSGKSTTARLMAQLLQPTSGTVELRGEPISARNTEQLRRFRREVQVVFQDPFSSLNPRHRVDAIISAPMRYLGLPRPAGGWTKRVKELMDRVGLNPDHSTRYPVQFSGGQAQRIGIARAISVEPSVVICDEAVSALDVSVQAKVLDLLADLQRDAKYSYVFITHDLAVVRSLAHRIAVMHEGRIVETGDREQIFSRPHDEYTRTLLSAVPQIKFDTESWSSGHGPTGHQPTGTESTGTDSTEGPNLTKDTR